MKFTFLARLCGLAVACATLGFAQTYTTSALAGSAGQSGSVNGTGAAARFTNPTAVGLDGAGNVFVLEASGTSLRKVTPAGVTTTVTALASGGAGVAVDATGVVYVADATAHVIRRIAVDGTASVVAGLAGTAGVANGNGGLARFNGPQALALDATGNLFVADTNNQTIRKITPAGDVTTVAGLGGVYGYVDGPGPLARFSSPGGVAVDPAGNLYIADRSNYVVRKITASGDVSTLAGSATGYYYGSSADGTGTAARFSTVSGIAVSAAGTVFVTESNTVR